MGLRTPVTATISAENSFSDWMSIQEGLFNFSVQSADWTGTTVVLQRTFDAGVTVWDVESLTANAEKVGEEPEGALYRFGVKTGAYGGTAVSGRIGQ